MAAASAPFEKLGSSFQRARSELERMVRAGETRCAECCIDQFPSLLRDDDALLDLIYTEFLLRERLGQAPNPREWYTRFPDQEADLRQVFQVHEELEAAADARPTADASASVIASKAEGSAGTIAGAYTLLNELGRGGMGVVYRARDIRLGRDVALKFLHAEHASDPAALDRFGREARAASSLQSAHICTVYELEEDRGVPFIAMELVAGTTVRERAAGATPREVAGWIAQVAEALRVGHAAGIVHRDIKPANIVVRPDGLAKVLDFGMARLLPADQGGLSTGDEPGNRATEPGALIGTVAYMSPEQARCESAGPESDVFSLGIVLYELLTRHHPFEVGSQVETLQAILTHSVVPPSRLDPAVPPDLDQLTLRMLSKDGRLRPTAAEVAASLRSMSTGEFPAAPDSQAHAGAPVRSPTPVGREAEFLALAAAYESAARERGRITFVTGEPGIGKTTLIDSFLNRLAAGVQPAPVVAQGRCSERLAGAEAYLPVLEAIEGLLRGPHREGMNRLIKLLAPSWYAQAAPIAREDSAVGPKVDSDAINHPQERLKREMLTFLEEATRDRPLVLFFDDLHWADPSTVDLLAYIGTKCASMRLLLLITYRPSDVVLGRHPLLAVKQELQAKGVSEEVALGMLGRDDVRAYVDREFAEHRFPDEFIAFVHRRSSGSPLFMVDLLRYLRDTGAVCHGADGAWALAQGVAECRRDLPESVRSMVQRKIDQLADDDRRLLAAAGVQGVEFDAAVVSDALRLNPVDVEERLVSLERLYGIIRRIGEKEFPDGTLTVHYAFVHVLYQNALYDSLQPSRRAALSGAVAGRLLSLHNGDGRSTAAELASLYEAARDFPAAAEHSLHAAGNAARLHAYQESALLARRGLDSLNRLPESPQRNRLELRLQVALGIATQSISKVFDVSSIASLRRARELCVELGDATRLSVVLWGMCVHHAAKGEYRVEAYEYATELLRLAEVTEDGAVAVQARLAMGITHMHRGEHALALPHFKSVIRLHDTHEHGTRQLAYGQHPAVLAFGFGALSLCYSGELNEWREWAGNAIALAIAIADPPSQSFAYFTYLWAAQVAGDLDHFAERLEEFVRISHEHDLGLWMAVATVFQGFLNARLAAAPATLDAAIDLIRDGIGQLRTTQAVVALPLCLTILAQELVRSGRHDEAFAAVEEGLASIAANGNTYAEAELRRLRGEVINAVRDTRNDATWLDGLPSEGDVDFAGAIETARVQGAKTLEWRATLSLLRSMKGPEKLARSHQSLQSLAESLHPQTLSRLQDATALGFPTPRSQGTAADL